MVPSTITLLHREHPMVQKKLWRGETTKMFGQIILQLLHPTQDAEKTCCKINDSRVWAAHCHMPDDNELLSRVSSHISNMNIAYSPGFDTFTLTFIKCATKRVPRHDGRGQENVYVIAPHITALFSMLMTQARIPGPDRSQACSYSGASEKSG